MEEVLNFGEMPVLERYQSRFYLYEGSESRLLVGKEIDERVEALKIRVERIFQLGKRVVSSFIEIGQALLDINRDQSFQMVRNKYETYSTIEEFAYKIFGFGRSTTYNLMNVAKRFTLQGEILPAYQDYTYSKLVQFLPLETERIQRFTPEVKVEEIKELRKGWERYGYDGTKTWQEELHRVRECAAAEVTEKEKKDRNAGFIQLLTGSTEAPVPQEAEQQSAPFAEEPAVEPEPHVVQPLFTVPAKEKHPFKNDAERKEFISWKNAAKWTIYIKVEEFHLHYHRMEFANGAVVIAAFGGEYSGYNHNTQKYDIYQKDKPHRLYLQTPEKPEFDMNGTSPSAIVEYMKAHRDEI